MATDLPPSSPPLVLLFGPLDPTGAAHLMADSISCARLGCHAVSVVTSLHVQDTISCEQLQLVPPEHVYDQMRCLLEDMPISAIKAGPLYSAEAASVLAQVAADYTAIPLVLQLQSLQDHMLADHDIDTDDVMDAIFQLVLPQTDLVVADSTLLEQLQNSGHLPEQDNVYQAVLDLGANQLLSATPAQGSDPARYVLLGQDGTRQHWPLEATPHRLHDTDSTLSVAIAAGLAQGKPLQRAIAEAIHFTESSATRHFQAGMGKLILNQTL